MNQLDERDEAIVAERVAEFDAVQGIRVGDYVRHSDGTLRRVAYVWEFDDGPERVQTTDGGSFHLGHGGCSFSGSLHLGIPADTLTLTDERMIGDVWIFHHGQGKAHNGVTAQIEFRVYACSLPAGR